MGEYNLGELLSSQAGERRRGPRAIRAPSSSNASGSPAYNRPAARLLEARLLDYLGRDEEARRLVDEIAAMQTEAERTGDAESVVPTRAGAAALVDLCTRDATDAEWTDLRRALADGVDRAGADRGRGDDGAGARATRADRTGPALLDEALALAETIPNVMEKRLQQAQVRLQVGEPRRRRVERELDAHFIGA